MSWRDTIPTSSPASHDGHPLHAPLQHAARDDPNVFVGIAHDEVRRHDVGGDRAGRFGGPVVLPCRQHVGQQRERPAPPGAVGLLRDDVGLGDDPDQLAGASITGRPLTSDSTRRSTNSLNGVSGVTDTTAVVITSLIFTTTSLGQIPARPPEHRRSASSQARVEGPSATPVGLITAAGARLSRVGPMRRKLAPGAATMNTGSERP